MLGCVQNVSKTIIKPTAISRECKKWKNDPPGRGKRISLLASVFLNSSSNSYFSCSNSPRQLWLSPCQVRLSPRLVRCQGFSGLSLNTFSRIFFLLGSISTPVRRILLIYPGYMLLRNSAIRSAKISWDQMGDNPVGNTNFHRGASFEPRTQAHASAKSASSHWPFQRAASKIPGTFRLRAGIGTCRQERANHLDVKTEWHKRA